VFVIIGAVLALAASTVILAVSWPKAPAPAVAKKIDAVAPQQAGHVVIPRANSDLCDRYLFDNVSNTMKAVETSPCQSKSKRKEVDISDQVNSFSSFWRGGK
jgi:hypothetical protein